MKSQKPRKSGDSSKDAKSQRGGDAGSGPTIQFINANPSGVDEVKKIRSQIRSQGAKWRWDQFRKAKTDGTSKPTPRRNKKSLAPGSTTEQIGSRPNKSVLSSQKITPVKSVEKDPGYFGDFVIRGYSHSVDDSAEYERLRGRDFKAESGSRVVTPVQSTGLLNLLNKNDVDPFRVFPTDLPKGTANAMIPQVIGKLYESFDGKVNASASETPLANNFIAAFLSSKVIFHSIGAFHFQIHPSFRRSPGAAQEPRESLYCRGIAIHELMEALQGPNACSDETIVAVLYLAHAGVRLPEDGATDMLALRKAPLPYLMNLADKGRMGEMPEHLRGLATMVKQRGGVSFLELRGLAPMICYYDVVEATKHLSKPAVEPFHPFRPDAILNLSPASQEMHPLYSMGSGFQQLENFMSKQDQEDLCIGLMGLRNYTLRIDDFVERRRNSLSLGELGDQRNFAQYCLMHLSCYEEIQLTSPLPVRDVFFELCHLSAVIYSITVTFPLPRTADLLGKLSSLIMIRLLRPEAGIRLLQDPSLSLWIGTMAAISSLPGEKRQWLVALLSRICRRLQIRSWGDMQVILTTFLWYERVAGEAGRKLWDEIQNMSPRS